MRESPAVRFGHPRDPHNYEMRLIDGIQVYVPHELPEIPLVIELSRFLGIKRLVVEGWRLA